MIRSIASSAGTEALPLSECYAKTIEKRDRHVVFGQTVFDHCLIVGRVAGLIAQTYPTNIRKRWFPKGTELIAATHDIGKVSPTFEAKLYEKVLERTDELPEALNGIDPKLEKGWGHAGVSELTADALNTGKWIPMILGCHHGRRPHIALMAADGEVVGGEPWQNLRKDLVEELKKALGQDWPHLKNLLEAKVLAGLTTVADWIGSGEQLELERWSVSDEKLRDAVRNAGFCELKVIPDLSFKDIFGFLPNQTQSEILDRLNGPGIYVLEAQMGLGKTEVALYAAYKLMAYGQATGLYFALPTQTTSESIWTRVNKFLSKIMPHDSMLRQAQLVHGTSWLKQTSMGADAASGGSWFSSSKRSILAPFGVGTVDQALTAVMNVKHGFVRTFGLLGKVVILDEVHSYDVYTGTILDELVRTLDQLGCTVIILSATLTKKRREALTGKLAACNAYPLFTAVRKGEIAAEETALAAPGEKKVVTEVCSDPFPPTTSAVSRALAGDQVLWIENTVGEAQEKYLQFKALLGERSPVEIGLIHSRFTRADRSTLEAYWVRLLGKNGGFERRNRGRILVGTQVLEQSLDIDADLLVTRICPIDMLLQRIGRLWRHEKTVRPAGAERKAWIVAPALARGLVDPVHAFGPTASVYAPYVLCRTLQTCMKKNFLSVPSDIRALIESAYAEGNESEKLIRLRQAMENGDAQGEQRRVGTIALRQLALSGLTSFAPESDDENPPTRYSQTETADVLILKKLEEGENNVIVTLWDGTILVLPEQKGAESAIALTRNCVSVPRFYAPPPVGKQQLFWLKGSLYVSSAESSRIRLAILGEDRNLYGLNGKQLPFSYSATTGYQKVPDDSESKE